MDWLLILFVALVHSTFAYYLFYASLERVVPVANFSLFLMLEPVFTVLLGIFLGEGLTDIQLLGVLLLIIPGYLFVDTKNRLFFAVRKKWYQFFKRIS